MMAWVTTPQGFQRSLSASNFDNGWVDDRPVDNGGQACRHAGSGRGEMTASFGLLSYVPEHVRFLGLSSRVALSSYSLLQAV